MADKPESYEFGLDLAELLEGEGVGLWVYVAQQFHHLAHLRFLAKPVHERDEVLSWDHLLKHKCDVPRVEQNEAIFGICRNFLL